MNRELTLKEAEKIVDDMYQKRWVECGIEDGNTIHMGNLDKLQYTELESASILLLRTEISLQKQNQKLQQRINKAIEYIKYCQTSDDDIFPVIEAEKMIEILKEVNK